MVALAWLGGLLAAIWIRICPLAAAKKALGLSPSVTGFAGRHTATLPRTPNSAPAVRAGPKADYAQISQICADLIGFQVRPSTPV